MDAGLYLHIPFCKSKCAYCDFASFAGQEAFMHRYAQRVKQEIAEKASRFPRTISTLFIGGGTPSLFPAEEMRGLLEEIHAHFPFAENAECTCECNPGTVTPAFLQMLKEMGINRLSFGAQAAQRPLLSLLGRIHTWDDVIHSLEMARSWGFENVNLDIMLGLPAQTEKDVQETLEKALALSPTHLSCYGLIVEEGTHLHRQVEKGLWQLPAEETERKEYALCQSLLSKNGFQQYEISNFALPGFACRHNLDCWRRKEYIGIGSAACGFIENMRWQNPPALQDYLKGVPANEEIISPQDAMFETMMLGLRTMEGVKEQAFLAMHGISLQQAYGEKLQKPLKEGLLYWQDGRVFLSRKGMDLQNRILVELL